MAAVGVGVPQPRWWSLHVSGLSCHCPSPARHGSLTQLGQGHKQPSLHTPTRLSAKCQVCDGVRCFPAYRMGAGGSPTIREPPKHTESFPLSWPPRGSCSKAHVSATLFSTSPASANFPPQSMRLPRWSICFHSTEGCYLLLVVFGVLLQNFLFQSTFKESASE